MEPTAREADADLLTVVWAWADGLVTDDEARGAVILHRQARLKLAGASLTPTPHRSPVVGLERGAVVVVPDHLHTTDIRVGGVYTNGKGLFRRVTDLVKIGAWVDVVYSAYRRDKSGRIVAAFIRNRHSDLSMGLGSFAEWARREATSAEVYEVSDV